jgi:hypothetical protein
MGWIRNELAAEITAIAWNFKRLHRLRVRALAGYTSWPDSRWWVKEDGKEAREMPGRKEKAKEIP